MRRVPPSGSGKPPPRCGHWVTCAGRVRRSTAWPRRCTTRVAWWERLLIAPNYVNYHLEHHLSAAVPCYRLKPLHKLLTEKGFFDGFDCLSHGYVDVVKRAMRTDKVELAPA